jgi:hypothetical protein
MAEFIGPSSAEADNESSLKNGDHVPTKNGLRDSTGCIREIGIAAMNINTKPAARGRASK